MTTLGAISGAAAAAALGVVGAFHPEPQDDAPAGIATLVLLGPVGPATWQAFTASPEAADGAADPMDRWSRRVIGGLAIILAAEPFFPFGGPPWNPFQRWAERGEGAVVSPVGMRATPRRGLWASYRGALGFSEALALPNFQAKSPCAGCAEPCRTACPAGAFDAGHYDVPACVAHIRTEAGAACRSGCLVRSACPAGRALQLPEEQRAFHMAAFLRTQA